MFRSENPLTSGNSFFRSLERRRSTPAPQPSICCFSTMILPISQYRTRNSRFAENAARSCAHLLLYSGGESFPGYRWARMARRGPADPAHFCPSRQAEGPMMGLWDRGLLPVGFRLPSQNHGVPRWGCWRACPCASGYQSVWFWTSFSFGTCYTYISLMDS